MKEVAVVLGAELMLLKAVRATGLVVMSFTLLVACGPIGAEWEFPSLVGRGEVSGTFEQLPFGGESDSDAIVLENGDFLSGHVVEIGGEVVHFAADMAEGGLKVPFKSLKQVWMKKDLGAGRPAMGEIALVEGGRFDAFIERVDAETVHFRTTSSEHSPEMAVDVNKVASIRLSAGALVLLEADFADGASSPFVANEGEWIVHKGQLLQSDPSYSRAVAYARIEQWGRMRYSWTVFGKDWGTGGMYILASDQNFGNGGSGYRIHLDPGRLSVYKGLGDGESLVFYCSLASAMNRAEVTVEHDCAAGEMRIWLEGRQMANLRDKEPVRSGEYVALLAQGRVAFDDIRVERFGGDVQLSQEEAGEDVVILRNGDKIVGELIAVSEAKVTIIPRRLEKELVIDRGKVLRVIFDGRGSACAKGEGIVFRDENRLEGKVRSLRDGVVVIENEVAGRLRFDAATVKSILFTN
jgi:hypothetical protein